MKKRVVAWLLSVILIMGDTSILWAATPANMPQTETAQEVTEDYVENDTVEGETEDSADSGESEDQIPEEQISEEETVSSEDISESDLELQTTDSAEEIQEVTPSTESEILPAGASSGTCGTNASWTLDSAGKLTISGIGAMTDYTVSTDTPWYGNRGTIKTIIIEDGITHIGEYAFNSSFFATKATIPASVTSAGVNAFTSCQGLTSAGPVGSGCAIEFGWTTEIPDNVFSNHARLTRVVLPDTITRIGAQAFEFCNGLTSIDIPDGVTTIGSMAFYGCANLEKITVPASVQSLPESSRTSGPAFANCPKLISAGPIGGGYNYEFGWTDKIPGNAFANTSLTSVKIPNTITSIETCAFMSCKGLTSIKIPDTVTTIGSAAFFGCSDLEKVTVPASVKTMEQKPSGPPFGNCTKLTSAGPIGGGFDYEFGWTDKIPAYAFAQTGLTKVKMPATVTTIESSSFNSCTGITSAGPVGSGCDFEFGWTTEMPQYAFFGFTELEKVIIPKSITKLGYYMTPSSTKLTSAGPIGSGCSIEYGWDEAIPQNAFAGADGINKVIIPSTITNIGGGVFTSKKALTSVGPEGSGCSIEYGWKEAIPQAAFIGATSITKFIISPTIKSMGSGVLNCSDALTSAGPIGSGSSIEYGWKEEIPEKAFYYSKIESIIFPKELKIIGDSTFQGCNGLESIIIPNGVTDINYAAFCFCKNLKTIELPDTLTNMDTYVFYGDTALTSVKLPKSLKRIEQGEFQGCSSLQNLTIPGTVNYVGKSAFAGDTELTITYRNTEAGWNAAVADRDIGTVKEVICTGEELDHWEQDDNGWYYVYADGTSPKNEITTIDGKDYYFQPDGYRAQEEFVKFNNNWYYPDEEGVLVTGWKTIEGKKYYFNEKHIRTTGWQQVDNQWYYMDSNGVMLTKGWHKLSDKWYYMDVNGARVTGWLQLGTAWYYMDGNGVMYAKGWHKISGSWYYMNASGARVTGWQTIGSVKYYMDSEGVMAIGWNKIGTKWFYFESSGAAVLTKGWRKISGKWYYLGSDGARMTGWQKIGSKWYYMNSSGVMLTGWQEISKKWYYMNGSGIMLTGWQQIANKWYYMTGSGVRLNAGWNSIDNKWYYMDANGARVTGWKKLDGKYYYMNSSGVRTTGWQKVGSKWYYMDGSGIMQTGWKKLGGKWYYMNSSGAMLTGWQKIDGKYYYMYSSGVMAVSTWIGNYWVNSSGVWTKSR